MKIWTEPFSNSFGTIKKNIFLNFKDKNCKIFIILGIENDFFKV